MQVQSLVAEALRVKNEVDWSAISAAMEKRNNISPADSKVYMKFVQLFGDGPFIADLQRYHAQFVQSNRIIAVSTFSAVCDIKLSPSEVSPRMAIAILKAQAQSPANKVQNRICKYITAGDIAACGAKRKTLFLEGEKSLVKCREIASKSKLPEEAMFKLVSQLDVLMANFVLKKDIATHKSIADIMAYFGSQVSGSSPVVASPASSTVEAVGVIRYDETGAPIASGKVCLMNAGCHFHSLCILSRIHI